jgi:hypothetical protein
MSAKRCFAIQLGGTLSLAWDPFKNGKSSVRAGFGIFDVLPLIHEFGMIEAS